MICFIRTPCDVASRLTTCLLASVHPMPDFSQAVPADAKELP
ncbi:hypothetical protein RMSM_06811 [Rhodopirellula maiorica SM1]|uniref:Uncharacterized protein n=1 Tax=Rhodopirellula maiorica SM1 TaxID=1265738 RepID=M5RA80_9BACT|nr:hypothetical protein RMSM_06811 [Rhodopirellula maiorica SM1]